MSFEQLESFVAVAEEGAVVHAARRLHLTQPPLSRRLQGLEDELGAALFVREARGMRLTAAGEAFLPHARAILAAAVAARAAVADCHRLAEREPRDPLRDASMCTPGPVPARSSRRAALTQG